MNTSLAGTHSIQPPEFLATIEFSVYGHPAHASRSNSLAEQDRAYVVACPEAIVAAFAFAPAQYATASIRPYGSAPT